MATKYLNLRFKFGGILVSEVGPIYVRGMTEYVENVDEDHLSIPELADYAKSFGISKLGKTYAKSLGDDLVELKNDMDICNIALFMHDGDTIDIYVCDDTILEDVGPSEGQISQSLSQVVESFNAHGEFDGSLTAQPKKPDLGLGSSSSFPSSERVENNWVARVQQETDDDYSSIDWTDTEEEGEPTVQQGIEPFIQEEVEPSAQENAKEDIDSDFICSNQSIDYGSDVHEELRIVKEDVRKFQESRRRKKKEKTKGFLGEVGLDEGYEDIEKGKKKFKGKLIEDEPYYDSSDCDSFQSDEEELVSYDELEGGSLRGRKESNRVIYDSTCDVVIWQYGLVFESVKEFREAFTKYSIKKRVELDKYVNESTRVRVKCKSDCPWLLYASKEGRSGNFTIKTYNPRHIWWEIQDLVRKELNVHNPRLQDVLLQTNPGSTCVVKLKDSESENGMKQFHSFYICFDAMKKGFQQGCRRCIGLDGCFLKGICKDQLLVAVAKDANNQMYPIAWAVIGTESKLTWKWFLTILQNDLNLGDGSQLTIISDMQKGLIATIDELFPECEHRMCARHILANWSQNFRGIERRKKFWACARSTFEA
ncbi:hypothetical protein KY290_011059 [Solanum tuberosum]|uniref:Uncharacterized protein n=1 Tax=Solanum tuberosum TaxID=4113 RepID=A0ABQ7VZJ5_SOLTU|nr:hypothetical protein KY290_011059 [Solanum tuberosum]